MRCSVPLAMLAGLGATLIPSSSGACSFADPEPHAVDPDLASSDTTPPDAVKGISFTITRGAERNGSGCGQGSTRTTCGDIGGWALFFTPPDDDQSAPTEIGYVVELVDGRLPGTSRLASDRPVSALGDGDEVVLTFGWHDDETAAREDVDFSVVIRAVDRAGNVSPPSPPVRLHDKVSSGCTVAPQGAPLTQRSLLLLPFVLLARRKTRSRAARPAP